MKVSKEEEVNVGYSSTHSMPRKKTKILELASTDFTFKMLIPGLIKAIKDADYDLTLACSNGPYVQQFRDEGYRVKTLYISPGLNPFHHVISLIRLYAFIRKEKFDIVHAHTPVASFICRLAAKLARAPFVVNTVHGLYFHENTHPIAKNIIVFLERFVGRFTDLTFSVSAEDVESAVRERICSADRIIATGNGVDLQRFRLDVAEEGRRRVREEFHIPLGADAVGMIGRIVKEKGFVEFVQSMPHVLHARPETRFFIVGDALPSDYDSVEEKVTDLVDAMGLSDNVLFTGLRTDIPELLSAMDVFVLPSYREGMPLVVLEAMAMARPVVATSIRGCREIVVDGETGILIPPYNVPALGEAIVRLLSDRELACRMGMAGRKRVEARFDLDSVVRKQLDALARLVSASSCDGAEQS